MIDFHFLYEQIFFFHCFTAKLASSPLKYFWNINVKCWIQFLFILKLCRNKTNSCHRKVFLLLRRWFGWYLHIIHLLYVSTEIYVEVNNKIALPHTHTAAPKDKTSERKPHGTKSLLPHSQWILGLSNDIYGCVSKPPHQIRIIFHLYINNKWLVS